MMGRASKVLEVTGGMEYERTPASISLQDTKIILKLCCHGLKGRTLDQRLNIPTRVCLLNLAIR